MIKSFPKPVKVVKKKKGLNRVRKTPLAKLKRELDKLMSTYVIMRDKKCVVCGSTERLTCGHLITRGKETIRWDFLNCACQCWGCNYKHEFYPEEYTNWFIKRYGASTYDNLVSRGHTVAHNRRSEYESIKFIIEDAIKNLKDK